MEDSQWIGNYTVVASIYSMYFKITLFFKW